MNNRINNCRGIDPFIFFLYEQRLPIYKKADV